MNNTTIIQLYLLLIYIVSGILIGIFFDIFRILRKSFKTPDLITYIQDILFWIFTGLFLIFVVFKFNNGQIRSYTIIGLLLGFIIYMLSISKHFIIISVHIIKYIKKIVSKIFNIILYPLKTLYNFIKKIILKPFTFFVINIKKNFINLFKNTKKHIKHTKKLKKPLGKEGF